MTKATLLIAPTKTDVPTLLNDQIVTICNESLQERKCFSVALSGGSLVSFLSTIEEAFQVRKVEPQFERWHVVLADERCVPLSSEDSNLGALKQKVLDKLPIPPSQIHGINQEKLNDIEALADEYETVLNGVLEASGGSLDLAVLGFGPDGHTCSLFPMHSLLKENKRLVGFVEDSPKPPPRRITMTFPALERTRKIIFCGAGESKSPILKASFAKIDKHVIGDAWKLTMAEPAPYPCAMVRPMIECIWIVDEDASTGVIDACL